jgi:hypothetical protein
MVNWWFEMSHSAIMKMHCTKLTLSYYFQFQIVTNVLLQYEWCRMFLQCSTDHLKSIHSHLLSLTSPQDASCALLHCAICICYCTLGWGNWYQVTVNGLQSLQSWSNSIALLHVVICECFETDGPWEPNGGHLLKRPVDYQDGTGGILWHISPKFNTIIKFVGRSG